MFKLNLVEERGWNLLTTDKFIRCKVCGIDLEKDFFFCDVSKSYFCQKCEADFIDCITGKIEEHSHFFIIILDVVNK